MRTSRVMLLHAILWLKFAVAFGDGDFQRKTNLMTANESTWRQISSESFDVESVVRSKERRSETIRETRRHLDAGGEEVGALLTRNAKHKRRGRHKNGENHVRKHRQLQDLRNIEKQLLVRNRTLDLLEKSFVNSTGFTTATSANVFLERGVVSKRVGDILGDTNDEQRLMTRDNLMIKSLSRVKPVPEREGGRGRIKVFADDVEEREEEQGIPSRTIGNIVNGFRNRQRVVISGLPMPKDLSKVETDPELKRFNVQKNHFDDDIDEDLKRSVTWRSSDREREKEREIPSRNIGTIVRDFNKRRVVISSLPMPKDLSKVESVPEHKKSNVQTKHFTDEIDEDLERSVTWRNTKREREKGRGIPLRKVGSIVNDFNNRRVVISDLPMSKGLSQVESDPELKRSNNQMEYSTDGTDGDSEWRNLGIGRGEDSVGNSNDRQRSVISEPKSVPRIESVLEPGWTDDIDEDSGRVTRRNQGKERGKKQVLPPKPISNIDGVSINRRRLAISNLLLTKIHSRVDSVPVHNRMNVRIEHSADNTKGDLERSVPQTNSDEEKTSNNRFETGSKLDEIDPEPSVVETFPNDGRGSTPPLFLRKLKTIASNVSVAAKSTENNSSDLERSAADFHRNGYRYDYENVFEDPSVSAWVNPRKDVQNTSRDAFLDSALLSSMYMPIDDQIALHESLAALLSRLFQTLRNNSAESRDLLQDLDFDNSLEGDLCQKWLDCKDKLDEAFLGPLDSLPACPCHYPSSIFYDDKIWDERHRKHFRWRDVSGFSERLDVYKPSATYCVRSLLAQGSGSAAAQHCCYDRRRRLLTRGSGAGTPNFVSPEVSAVLHERIDILPWRLCKGDFSRFNGVRPPNNGNHCKANPNEEEYQRQIADTKYY